MTYEIYKSNSFLTSARIAQANASGWTQLGTWDFDGEDVVITVLDNQTVQHWENDGVASSRIGIDAIAMRCTLRCDSRPGVPSGVTFQNGRAWYGMRCPDGNILRRDFVALPL